MEKETRTLMVEMEIPIQAKRKDVWDTFVNDISAWWRKDSLWTGAGKISLEPKVGGRMFEDLGNGAGALWYTVEAFIPNELILLSGVMSHEWGGPCRTMLNLRFEDDGKGTKVKLVDTYIGHISKKAEGSFEEGWTMILKDTFKSYVEKKFTL